MIPKPGKKPKTMKQGRWAKLMDRWVAYIVILRDRRCVTCGRADNLQPGHYLSRTRNSTRWDLINTHAQCGGCNILHEMNPEPYRRYIVSAHGELALLGLEAAWSRSAVDTLTPLRRTEIANELWGFVVLYLAQYYFPSDVMINKLRTGRATNREVMDIAAGFRKSVP